MKLFTETDLEEYIAGFFIEKLKGKYVRKGTWLSPLRIDGDKQRKGSTHTIKDIKFTFSQETEWDDEGNSWEIPSYHIEVILETLKAKKERTIVINDITTLVSFDNK